MEANWWFRYCSNNRRNDFAWIPDIFGRIIFDEVQVMEMQSVDNSAVAGGGRRD